MVSTFVWGRSVTILITVICFAASMPSSRFGSLERLNLAVNNYKDNINCLYWHPDMTLTTDTVLSNVIMSAFSHYINTWMMNRACMGMMFGMLEFAQPYGHYKHWENHLLKELKKKRLLLTIPLPPIDIDTICIWNKWKLATTGQCNYWAILVHLSMPSHWSWKSTMTPCWQVPDTSATCPCTAPAILMTLRLRYICRRDAK